MTRWMLILGLAIAGAACGKTVVGTETGNPPAISSRLVAIVAIDDERVRVSGEAGAVTPGGGEISVVNTTRDGEPVTAEVAEDGSFSVELEGAPDDDYELVASNGDGSSPAKTVSGGGAGGAGGSGGTGGTGGSGGSGEPPGDGWQDLHRCDESDPRDPLTVTDLRVEYDVLFVSVSHGGGCAEHRYGLCYSGEWQESYPIQVGFEVLHDDGGDDCFAALSEDLSFDLTPFKQAYREAYPNEDGGGALLGFDSCDAETDCGVLYAWGAAATCGPPIGAFCPPFDLPAAPDDEGWVEYDGECGFSFVAPDDLVNLNEQGTDSCHTAFENDACALTVGSGPFSGGLREFESDEEYEVGQTIIDGLPAKVVTASRSEDQETYFFAGVHFPDPFGNGPESGITADLYFRCDAREERDALLPVLGTIRFD